MAINQPVDRRAFERRLFLFIVVAITAITFLGFARTYYLLPALGGNPLRLVTHIHGMLMSAWTLLFALQVYLIRSKNVKVHMRLGRLGVALAVMIVVVGILTALSAAKYGSPSFPPDVTPLGFMIVPFTDMVLFPIFFGLAVYWRKRAADHKRMMMLTAISILPAAVVRIPVASLQALGPLWFFGFPDVLLIGIILYDRWRTGKFNVPLAIGAAVLIASHPFRLMMMETEAWLAFANWAVSFV